MRSTAVDDDGSAMGDGIERHRRAAVDIPASSPAVGMHPSRVALCVANVMEQLLRGGDNFSLELFVRANGGEDGHSPPLPPAF